MLAISSAQISGWIAEYFWPFLRVGAMLGVTPIFGGKLLPTRVRLGFSVALTAIIVPIIPDVPKVELFSAQSVLITMQQLLIGLLMGFVLRLVFSALENGGQIIAMLMGLGFATMVDPKNGVQVPVVSQLFTIFAVLLFFAMNGHLVWIEVIAKSFIVMPIGIDGIVKEDIWSLVVWAKWIFSGAVMLAIPAIGALLMVNLSFGIMTRAAPQLNILTIGFPIMLLIGFIALLVTLPTLAPQFKGLLHESLSLIDNILL